MNMKRFFLLLFLNLILLGCAAQGFHALAPTPTPAPFVWSVYFSPKGGCTEAIVHELEKAQKTIFVQAYSFTSAPIADALINAHQRGVKVMVIMGRGKINERASQVDFLAENGIPIKIYKHTVHSKVMVIDEEITITGSFNFTQKAERNLENLLIIREKALAEEYTKNFWENDRHSEPYL